MIGCIAQARMGSRRLPDKTLMKLDKKNTVLDFVINQLLHSKTIDKIVIATTNLKEDDVIENHVKNLKVDCFRGNPNDVLDRYYQCAKKYSFKTIVRITCDCPLIDPQIVDQTIEKFHSNSYDYVTNHIPPTFPYGIAVDVFSFNAIENAWINAKLPSEREHVILYFQNNKGMFSISNISFQDNFSHLRLTIDRINDIKLIQEIVSKIHKRPILLNDIINLYSKEPTLFDINKNHDNDEGLLKSLMEDKEFINIEDENN